MNSLYVLVFLTGCLAVLHGCLAAKTKCEEHRERELSNTAPVKFVPECTEEGDYETLQCFVGGEDTFCMCMAPDGKQIIGPNVVIRKCECPLHNDRQIAESKQKSGVYIPTCNEDGTYFKKQCHKAAGVCWCTDEKGNKVSEDSRRRISC